ncbi:MAG: phenylacetic acid degradation operon negative regulatory protein [Gammaproteobacteria bacterium]|nr:phenylacetic acid degradation operon negative regulatory protein [Gammaproteobacteria bacterium]
MQLFLCHNNAVKSTVATTTQSLLRRFQSQRPIRGGSLLVTIFGDALAPRGGVVTLGSLIQLAAPFGLTERLVRTSVARLAQDGWLVARRDGRLSEYRLAPRGQQRFAEATQRIYSKGPVDWDGHWSLLILPPNGNKRRENLRDSLRWLGFGQVSPGVFAHPNGNLQQTRKWLQSLDVGKDALLLESSSDDVGIDQAVVAAGWDLGDLARRYKRFADAFSSVETALASRETVTPEAAFVIRTLLIHEYRKIHLQDPLLPPALLPGDWVGSTAYDSCARLYGKVFTAAEQFLTVTASTLDAALPKVEPSVYERFGGIRT